MQHPEFITPERIARICGWPTSDRRQLVERLSLTDAGGWPVNHKDEIAFWQALLRYLSNGRGAYRELTDQISHLSANSRKRNIHFKCIQVLCARCPEVGDCLDFQGADFTRVVCDKASQAGAIVEVADWLWAHWLFTGEADVINSIVEADPQLSARFGKWRALPDELPIEVPVEPTSVTVYTEEKPVAVDVATADDAFLFVELRSEVQRAAETTSPEPLLAAKAIIEVLVERLQARRAEEAESARSALQDVVLRLRDRGAPADAKAATCRMRTLEKLADLPTLVPADARAAARDIANKIDRADEAKHAFELAETAHMAARFDGEKLQAYYDALARYGDAESGLTARVEELAATVATLPSSKSMLPAKSEGELEQPDVDEISAPACGNVMESSELLTGATPAPQKEAAAHAGERGALAHFATSNHEELESSPVETSGAEELLAALSEENLGSSTESDPPPLPDVEALDLEPNESVPVIDEEFCHQDEHAIALAESFLRRGNIGLFAIACEVGRELRYGIPLPQIAVAVGTSGLSEPLRGARFTDAVKWLLTNTDLERMGSGEVCLLFAALCLPAITDPTFVGRNALSRLKLERADFSAAIALRKSIDDLGRAYSGVQEFMSTGSADPEEEFKNARAAAQQAAATIRTKTVNYHAATVVAHRLAQDLAEAAARTPTNIDAFIKGLDKALPPDLNDDELIRRVDREIREGKADRKPIEARALSSLRNIMREAREVTSRLRRAASMLYEQRRSGTQSREVTYRKGRELKSKFNLAAVEFRKLANIWNSEDLFASTSAHVASVLLDAHASAFDTGIVENPFCDSLELDRYRLARAIFDPSIPEPLWETLQKLADDPTGTWLDVFEEAIERREHRATQALLRVAQPLAGSRKLASERAEAIAQARKALRDEYRCLQDELLAVMNYAPAGETSLDPLYQSLASIDADQLPRESPDDLPSDRAILDFPDAFAEIDHARKQVHAVKKNTLEKLEIRLNEQAGRAPTETIRHLRELIEDGDLITLSEELSLIERGQDIAILPPSSIVVEEFSRFLINHGHGTLAEWQRGRTSKGGRAEALIRKWRSLTAAAMEPRRVIRDLFGELGFEPKGEAEAITGQTRAARVRHFKISTRVISDREFCSVARFGSEAEGQYRILVTAKDPKPNEIVTAVPEGDTGATMIFVPQWIGKDMRLQIASEARRLSRTFCLIDDALVAFLCDRDRIIRDLFGCGIPFAAASPYVTTPGSIPIEAFFGRVAEVTNISSRDGSCIVYGGRQLGKSVLLDHIEQRSTNAMDRIAVRLDCQDITERRELFEFIEKKLHMVPASARGDIVEAIESWLRRNPERTILLMLDETNKLVRADAERNFDVLLEFRGLMERTNRRFKVVLSGQNNVLRLTQTPNTPLAHFGQPICIGPLKGADYKAARDLVAEPLAAVGYMFAEEQLISRILVETQFYPKLVQMFCRDLLNHLRSLPNVHSELPPWQITLAHVEATLRNQKLTKDIFETFKITLDLDKRYELIALIMALERSDQRKRGGVEIGMTQQELRDQALYWWKDGFTSSNVREEFEGLLEELEGLGILINDRSTRSYQLTSPIIANLIGSEESVYDRLLSFDQLPPVMEVEPSKRRAEDNPPPRKRGIWLSPLVPAQVNRIVRARRLNLAAAGERIFVVYGSPDMRLDRIAAALEPNKYDEHQGIAVTSLDDVTSVGAFAQRLASASKPTFFIIPSKVAWNATWVDAALRSERGHVIVFIGDLGQAWSHIVEDPRGIRRLEDARIETAAPLSMIELEDQIRRSRLSIAPDALAAIMAETGGFLGPVGQCTGRQLGAKRDQRAAGTCPRFETLPAAGRDVVRVLIEYFQPDDALDSDVLGDACDRHEPKRLFDWLLWTGLAELVVMDGVKLRLNRVFWFDGVRRLLTA